MESNVAVVEDKPEVILEDALNTLVIAKEFKVTSPSMYELAADELATVKTGITTLTNRRLDRTRKLDELKKLIMADYAPAIGKLEEAKVFYEQGMLSWNAEQRRIQAEEQRRLDNIANAEKNKLEAEARKIEQEAANVLANAKGKKQKEEAAAAQQRAAEEAEALRLTSAVVVAAVAVTDTPKVSGTSQRSTWNGRCDNKMELIKFVANHPEYEKLLDVGQTALNSLAKSQKKSMKIDGCVAVEDFGITSRRI